MKPGEGQEISIRLRLSALQAGSGPVQRCDAWPGRPKQCRSPLQPIPPGAAAEIPNTKQHPIGKLETSNWESCNQLFATGEETEAEKQLDEEKVQPALQNPLQDSVRGWIASVLRLKSAAAHMAAHVVEITLPC